MSDMPKEVLDALQTDPTLTKAGLVPGEATGGVEEPLPPGPAALRQAAQEPSFEQKVETAFYQVSTDMQELKGISIKHVYQIQIIQERLSDLEAKMKHIEKNFQLIMEALRNQGPKSEDLPLG